MNRVWYRVRKFIYKILDKRELLMALNVKYYKSKGVKIGENMRAFSPLLSAEPYLLSFGHNVTVSTKVTFLTHDNSVIKLFENGTDIFGEIKVGNNCFIGSGSIILPGIELGNNVIVGAGSVVTKSFKEGNVIIAGNPAKVISTTENYASKISSNVLNIKGLSYDDKKYFLEAKKYLFVQK
ncbi:acyltransferase [Peribacillus simplex]|uniref:acyltransferase n=1 Tax=Peribacillus simplex TaxID=1478 RepID=UPI003267C25E